MKAPKKLGTFVKLGLGVCLVVYVLRSEIIDFDSLGDVLLRPSTLLTSFLFLSLLMCLNSWRWQLLTQAQDFKLSFRDVFSISMIGMFFNTFLPGSVGGDVIKAWYIAKREPSRKTHSILTIIADRILGLCGFVLIAAIVLIFAGEIRTQGQLPLIAYSLWGALLVISIALFCLFVPGPWKEFTVVTLQNLGQRLTFLSTLITSLLLYSRHGKILAKATAVSLCSALCLVAFWATLSSSLNFSIAPQYYLLVVPLGLIAAAVPLLPGGLGVGQVAFYSLFVWIGVSKPENGATLCTLVQAHTILYSLIGGILYLRYKSTVTSVKELNTQSQELSAEATAPKRARSA